MKTEETRLLFLVKDSRKQLQVSKDKLISFITFKMDAMKIFKFAKKKFRQHLGLSNRTLFDSISVGEFPSPSKQGKQRKLETYD